MSQPRKEIVKMFKTLDLLKKPAPGFIDALPDKISLLIERLTTYAEALAEERAIEKVTSLYQQVREEIDFDTYMAFCDAMDVDYSYDGERE